MSTAALSSIHFNPNDALVETQASLEAKLKTYPQGTVLRGRHFSRVA